MDMRGAIAATILLTLAGYSARAESLADTVTLGSVATLAPLCGLRDNAWSADLRRAAVQRASATAAHDDPDLKAAPGSNLAVGALSYADTEATESFAEAPPEETCAPLAASPDLRRADTLVDSFRREATAPHAW